MVSITEGTYFSRIHEKHILAYGKNGADNIVKNVRETYSNLMIQLNNSSNHNSLLVGKVQSGKTSNLELLTALAFDNGYNLLVIYGGYDTDLLRQCTERFSETFNAASENELNDSENPVVFTTNDTTRLSNTLTTLSEDFARELLEENRPVIITCLKRPPALNKTNILLQKLMRILPNIKPFIIDDEGDQASLNTAKDKAKEGTATYKSICRMKRILDDPLYLSVTATPQANIFQEDISDLIPDSIHLIQPGIGYNGAGIYHLSENDIVCEIIDNPNDKFPTSLLESIQYFIIVSAIKSLLAEKKKDKKSDMIIHSDRKISEHKDIYSTVCNLVNSLRAACENKDNDKEEYTFQQDRLKRIYDKYLSNELKSKYKYDDKLENEICIVVRKMGIILQNGQGKYTKDLEKTKLHKIFIGGDLLQRGLTFPNLLVSYFTRFAKSGGNMDTTLQRARWFGYRSKYLELCKIFTTEEIAKEFAVLAEIEDDLWEQFADVEKGVLAISDIIIQAEDTNQKPTAKNKAKYKKVKFKNRWIQQKFIVDEDNLIQVNNEFIKKMFSSITDWKETTEGSNVNQSTAKYTKLCSSKLLELLQCIETSFEKEPLKKQYITDIRKENDIPVILMGKGIEDIRYRSIYDDGSHNQIKALHQGANTTDETKLTYFGDKKVIIDPNKINIQIHHISPGLTKNNRLNKDQFMFAIYLPKDKIYFVKDNE